MSSGVTGLLFSQIGYEAGRTVRLVVRGQRPEDFSPSARVKLSSAAGDFQQTLNLWGECWHDCWWEVCFPPLPTGRYAVELWDNNRLLLSDDGLEVGPDLLWRKTWRAGAIEMLEARCHFAHAKEGWQDAGTLWQESNAHSAMVLGLCEVLEGAGSALSAADTAALVEQIRTGCAYLDLTRQKARELGFARGSLSHDLCGNEEVVLPADAAKAVAAWAWAARLLEPHLPEAARAFLQAARETFRWLVCEARPLGSFGFNRRPRGLAGDYEPPPGEWPTRELFMRALAGLELTEAGEAWAAEEAWAALREAVARQVTEADAVEGYYGHFREFASHPNGELAWTHSLVAKQFGVDAGAQFPFLIEPLQIALKRWPTHPDAALWDACFQRFAFGFLLPACEANPFRLVPIGIFPNEGPIWFAGLWHGMNAVYGLTAATAMACAAYTKDSRFQDIAEGNLQWVAGLNAGLTQKSLQGSVVYRTDIPLGRALPVSMICHIGARWAGSWFATRGAIANGFATGSQFEYDTDPCRDEDTPSSFTDEDWIPHTAGWLTGLVRWRQALSVAGCHHLQRPF